MTKLTLFFALLLLSSFIIINKNVFINYDETKKEICEISYNKNKKLSWYDFKLVEKTNNIIALSNTGINYEISKIGNKLYVYVNCVFNKNGSFVVRGNINSQILNHEQRHFDITYLFTCIFINKLKNETSLNEEKIELIYNNILVEWNNYQEKYDASIRNPILDNDIQINWDSIIDKELNKYN